MMLTRTESSIGPIGRIFLLGHLATSARNVSTERFALGDKMPAATLSASLLTQNANHRFSQHKSSGFEHHEGQRLNQHCQVIEVVD